LENTKNVMKAMVMSEHLAEPVNAQERFAYADMRYKNHLEGLKVAIYEDEKFSNLRAAAEAKRPAGSPDVTLFGTDTLRAPLRFLVEECRRQQLIKRSLDVDEILAPAAALLEGVAIP